MSRPCIVCPEPIEDGAPFYGEGADLIHQHCALERLAVSLVRDAAEPQSIEFDGVYWPTVQPGMAPGSRWVRICAGDELIAEHAIDDPSFADRDASIATDASILHGESRTYIYDGDSGACLKTIIVGGAPT